MVHVVAQGSHQERKHLLTAHAQYALCQADEAICCLRNVYAMIEVVVWHLLVGLSQL